MTAPSTNGQAPASQRWIQCIYAQIAERHDASGKPQPDQITTAASYGLQPVVLRSTPPARSVPKTKPPGLPVGVEVTCEDRVLRYDIEPDNGRELLPNEVAAMRAWLLWRWSQYASVAPPAKPSPV
jgi:hypothetical protein